MVSLSTAGHQAQVKNGHSEWKHSCFFESFGFLFINVSLELFRAQVNVSIFDNIKFVIKNALEVVFFIQ